MSEVVGKRRPYVRSMRGWWRRDPVFARYLLREATSVGVLVYALIMTVGVVRLAEGAAAWGAWLAALRSPWALPLHLVLFAAFVLHAHSWFVIMPKTMPLIFIGGRRLSATTITRTGWAATLLASFALLTLAWWWPT